MGSTDIRHLVRITFGILLRAIIALLIFCAATISISYLNYSPFVDFLREVVGWGLLITILILYYLFPFALGLFVFQVFFNRMSLRFTVICVLTITVLLGTWGLSETRNLIKKQLEGFPGPGDCRINNETGECISEND